MKKLSLFGIGPKMAVVLLPWLAISITLSIVYPDYFLFSSKYKNAILATGIILLIPGILLYGFTVKTLLKGINETRLLTSGTFSMCRNPLYAVIILIMIPALALIMNSWLILTSSLAGYIMFRLLIKSEYNEMEQVFGNQYLEYKNTTPEFLPDIRALFRNRSAKS